MPTAPTDQRDPPSEPSSPADVLAAAVAKGLIDQALAHSVSEESARTGQSPTAVLVARGILTPHIVVAIERDIARARGPRTIGGYRIIDEIGRGGMGVVYRAEQLSVGRAIALKVMREANVPGATTLGSEFAERFLREARTAASINHPQVVTVFDAGRDGDDLYLAMELVVGGDAAHLRDRHGGKLPPRLAVAIVRDAAKGLAAIHRVGLIHRDIKPSNIFIGEDGGAKLADLGLARRTGDDNTHITITGAVLGTPAYMSPEQAEGLEIDIRSDIYALGATLYALVTGQDPYTGGSAMAVAAKAIAGPFPDARTVVPDLPEPLVGLIGDCTAHDRGRRYPGPAELVAACDLVLEQLPGAPAAAQRSSPSAIMPAKPPTPAASAAPSSASGAPVAAGAMPAIAPAPGARPAPPPRGGWAGVVVVIIAAAGVVGGAAWWVADGMDRDQQRDALMAAIAALSDHATPAAEADLAAQVAAYDRDADDQRRALVDQAWAARRQGIDRVRSDGLNALLAQITATPVDADPAEESRIAARIGDYDRHADPDARRQVDAAWTAREGDIHAAKSAAFIAAVAAVHDDGDGAAAADLDRLEARLDALAGDGVPPAPMQAALERRRADLAAARQAAADKARADADAAAAATTADRTRQALAARQQAIDDGLATLDQAIAEAQAALRDASARAGRYAAADDPRIRDDLHDFYGARRAAWDGYVAHLAGDADLAAVTTAGAAVRDRRAADPAAAEAALGQALPIAKKLPDQRAGQRREADDSLIAWCWNRALTGDPTGLIAVRADVPAAADLIAPRIAEVKQRLAVLDGPAPVPDHAATAVAVIAQQVPGDPDAARWQAKLDEIARLRMVLAPLDQPGLPTPDQRQAAPRLAALVGGDDAQAMRCRDRLDHIDQVGAHLARLEAWPPPSADDLAALRGDETAWETLTGDTTSATVATHRALLIDPLSASDQAAALATSPASAAAPAGAATLRILGHGDTWRLAGYDGAGILLCWYRLTLHAVGDGWHLVPAGDPHPGGSRAAAATPMAVLLPGTVNAGALLWRAGGADIPATVTALAADRLPPFQHGARTVAQLAAAAPTAAARPADGRPAWAADFGNDACGPWADLSVATANAPVVQRLRLLLPGTFTMGSPADESGRDRDETLHAVTLTKALWLADSPCTQAMWQAVMGTNPSQFRGDLNRPVEQVSWQDCTDFCAALTKRGNLTARLPTESEWEYAARAGAADAPGGGAAAGLGERAWFIANADGATHAVRGKRANPWGFYDMLGNVQQWCDDWYGPYPGPATDPVGAAPPPPADTRHATIARRNVRGASWRDGPDACRPAARTAHTPDFSLNDLGFRFAITAP